MISQPLGALRPDAGEFVKLLDELIYWLGGGRGPLIDYCLFFQPYPLGSLPFIKGKGEEFLRKRDAVPLKHPEFSVSVA